MTFDNSVLENENRRNQFVSFESLDVFDQVKDYISYCVVIYALNIIRPKTL